MVSDSRFNVAGLNNETIPILQKQLYKLVFDVILIFRFLLFLFKINVIKTYFFDFRSSDHGHCN